MPFVAPKMAVSQFKSEEEFCRDSENGRKTLPRFESGRGDLHAHRVSRKNLDYVCCRSSFALPRGTTCFPKQLVHKPKVRPFFSPRVSHFLKVRTRLGLFCSFGLISTMNRGGCICV